MHAHPILPEPETAQDALDDILLVDERNDAHCFAMAFIAPTEQKLGKSNPPADQQSNPFHVIPDRERSP